MKKLMSILGVVAVLTGTCLAQVAPEKGPHGKHGKHGKYKAMLDAIPDLTEEQETQIKAIHKNGREQMKPQREELKEIRMKMVDLKAADYPDQGQINDLIDRQASLKAEMMKTRTAAEIKARSILTPEQRKVLDAKRKENTDLKEVVAELTLDNRVLKKSLHGLE